MTTPVDYYGNSVSLRQLATLTGIKQCTLKARHDIGDRGERLWRPLDPAARTKTVNAEQRTDLEDGKRVLHSKRDQDRQRQSTRDDRNRLRAEHLAAIRAAHAEAMKQPLIAADLISTGEREAIRANVIGKQRFWTVDSAYGVRR